ncbi:phosphoglucomutase/phosphomannomutase family protein [bacterium]|nr:phosphoglucomutase/phosphomannomutase family protein [bacterium]
MSKIKFGTDGWRAVVGEEFNDENVARVVKAIGQYVYSHFGVRKPVLIGYDPRNLAPEFAKYASELFSAYGIKVFLSDKIVPTPVIAFSAKRMNSNAVMFTASHNPPEYLGIKFIPDYGGPATNEITREIVYNTEENIEPFGEAVPVNLISFEEEYIAHLEKIIDFKRIEEANLYVNYDGHHGAAALVVKTIMNKYHIKNTSLNLIRDVNFGGFMPDPKEKYLPELKKLCKENHSIGLSNDGDGDRFGVFNEKGEFVSANEIIAILLLHLVKNKGYSGKLAKTVGASSMLDLIAKKTGVDVILTPVGFKWLGEAMRNEDVIIAGEESGGLSIKGHIPEKDGILADYLILEAMAYSGKKLFELQEELRNLLGTEFYSDRLDFSFSSNDEQQKVLDKFLNLKEFSGKTITDRNFIDGAKYIFDDGSWILVRKSGTEPLLRIYFEAQDKDTLDFLEEGVKKFVEVS